MNESAQRSAVVVDDNQTNAAMIREFLQSQGYRVELAFTAQEGLSKIVSTRPDIVILDLVLPDMRGSEMCARLRASPATRDIPIILCTAYQITTEEKVRGLRAGADDYLVRPFALAELAARMEAVFRRVQLQPKPDTLAGISAVVEKSAPTAGVAAPAVPRTVVVEPVSPTKREAPNIVRRLWDVLNRPLDAFQSAREHEDMLPALAFVAATPLALSLSLLTERGGGFDAWIGLFSLGSVVQGLMWVSLAGFLHMVLPFQGAHVSFRKTLMLAGLTWAPRLLEAVLALGYACLSESVLGGHPGHFSAGLDIVPGLGVGSASFFAKVGAFDAWAAWLTLVAVWTACGIRHRRWNSISIIVGLVCLLLGMLAH